MNPGADRGSALDGAAGVERERTGDQPATGRSWEPPSWPSDTWDLHPRVRQRAIGWRAGRGH